ncbi:Predicted dehydrogenase, partial [Candidatus Kryptonium thompsonii]
TAHGINANHVAKKYHFQNITTNYQEVIQNQDINSVVILTPHSSHAKMVIEALKANKHVFVEKPLCINEEELKEIYDTYVGLANKPFLMVGYNRRFSPHSQKLKETILNRRDPVMIYYRINAGFVQPNHWVHSEEEGGGRIIGEVCHFVDLMMYFTDSLPFKVYAERVSGNNKTIVNDDNVSVTIKFSDGSVGNIFYSASGDKAFSRERVEVYCEGKTILINDFKETQFWFGGKTKKYKTINQEIGYNEELKHFANVISGIEKPKISFEEIYYSTLAVFKINESLIKGKPIQL